MKPHHWDWLAGGIFLSFLAAYTVLAWFASQDVYSATFDSIHGYRIFDIDDSYRRYLAATSFSLSGIWVWNFYLPFNLVFDGFFSWLTQHSAFWMRVPHLLANLFGLWLVYRAGRRLRIHPAWLLLACCTLMWMPLYVLVSMSFYGESLLAAVMGVAIYTLVTRRGSLFASSAAVMPFVRPEGAFYLVFLALQAFQKKRFLQLAWMLCPAALYFLVLMSMFGFSWSTYWQDRSAYGSTYTALGAQAELVKEVWLPYFTINPIWWLLGLAGGLLPSMRRFRPLFLGAVLLMVYWAMQMAKGHAHGEARYYFSLLPLFALSQAALLQAVTACFKQNRRRVAGVFVILLMFFIGVENGLQLDPLRNTYFDGNRYPVGQSKTRYKQFNVLPPAYSRVLKEAYAFVCAYANYDTSVDKVIVNSFQWFNKSTVCKLPDTVSVELSFQSPDVVYQYLQGYFLSMYPTLPHYAFYRFFPAPNERMQDGNHYALYVTLHDNVFPGETVTPLFTNQVFNIYKVRYNGYLHTPFFP